MLKWLSGVSSWRFCHRFKPAEVLGCLGLASLSFFSFTADSSNVLPVSTIFPPFSHKSCTNSSQPPGLPPTPPASRPICYNFCRQICCLVSLVYPTTTIAKFSSLHPKHMQCSFVTQGSQGWPNTSSYKPDHTTRSLAALHLVLHLLFSTSKSPSSFKAQPNCIPPAYPLLLSIVLSLPLLCSSSIPQPYNLQSYVSLPHPLITTRPPMIQLSFPGSLISPLLLGCWQQIKQNTDRVYVPLLLPTQPSPHCSSSSLQGRNCSFWRCETSLGILCKLMRIKKNEHEPKLLPPTNPGFREEKCEQ